MPPRVAMLNRETTMKVTVMHLPFGRGIQTSRKRLVSAVRFIFPENVIRELDAKPPPVNRPIL